MDKRIRHFVASIILPVEYPDGTIAIRRGLEGLGYDHLDMFLHEVTTLTFEYIKEIAEIDARLSRADGRMPIGALSWATLNAYSDYLMDAIPGELEGASMHGRPFEYGPAEYNIVESVVRAMLHAVLLHIPESELEVNTLTLARMGTDFIELRMEGPQGHQGVPRW